MTVFFGEWYRGKNAGGFTLLELLVTMAVIIVIVAVVLINYTTFTSRSSLRVRAAELSEFIRFAQERSASTEQLNAVGATEGFQSVRVLVRDGKLAEARLEKTAGSFGSFASSVAAGKADFAASASASVVNSLVLTPNPQENYFVDVCYIDTDVNSPASPYFRRSVKNGSVTCRHSSNAPTYMLCGEPDPSSASYNEVAVLNNDFDIHISVEQPTREGHANLIAVSSSGVYQYGSGSVQPEGASMRVSDRYEGVRIVLITDTGLKRSIDVYRTGLVSVAADDTAEGCERATTLSIAGVPLPPPGCPAGNIDHCLVTNSANQGTSGACDTGYLGSCSYRCDRGAWSLRNNSCSLGPSSNPGSPGGGNGGNGGGSPQQALPDPATVLCSVDARDTFGSELYDDCHELLDLTNDPDTIFHDLNWSSTVPILDWDGVSFDNNNLGTGARMTLNFHGYNVAEADKLSGTIPPEIGNLQNLRYLYLGFNNITGTIPSEIGSLALIDLNLSNNSLTGSIPESFGNLVHLRSLYLQNNELTGSIPLQLQNLTRLQNFSLSHNDLIGSIPAVVGQGMTRLRYVRFEENMFSGCIPQSFPSAYLNTIVYNTQTNSNGYVVVLPVCGS